MRETCFDVDDVFFGPPMAQCCSPRESRTFTSSFQHFSQYGSTACVQSASRGYPSPICGTVLSGAPIQTTTLHVAQDDKQSISIFSLWIDGGGPALETLDADNDRLIVETLESLDVNKDHLMIVEALESLDIDDDRWIVEALETLDIDDDRWIVDALDSLDVDNDRLIVSSGLS